MPTQRHTFTRFFLTTLMAATIISLTPTMAQADTPAPVYPTSYTFNWVTVGGWQQDHAVVGNGGSLVLTASMQYHYYNGYMVRPHLRLESSLDNVAWQNVPDVTVAYDGAGNASAATPTYVTAAKRQQVRYRFTSDAYANDGTTGVDASTTSKTVTITYENQGYYTGVRAKVYGYVRAYCPNTAVRITNLPGDHAGEYVHPSLLISVYHGIRQELTVNARTIALHECAHEHQFLNYGETVAGWTTMTQDVTRVFTKDKTPHGTKQTPVGAGANDTFDPIEHAADCAALAINPRGYLAYGGYCNPAELAAGRALLTGARLTSTGTE